MPLKILTMIIRSIECVHCDPINKIKHHAMEKVKVPLMPKLFLSRQEGPFCSDRIGEKIIAIQFFLDFKRKKLGLGGT